MATEPDPFRAPRSRRPLVYAGAGAAGLLAVGIGFWLFGGGEREITGPEPLVADLVATDWLAPAERDSGYRRLATIFAGTVRFGGVALHDEGTLAFALESRAGHQVVVRSASGELRRYPFPTRVTALGFSPEGELYIGLRSGVWAVRRTDGVVETSTVSSGNSVEGFAFDRDSRRSAVMVAGGGVFTALRPLQPGTLSPFVTPSNARIREVAFYDGDLVLGGDGGAVLVHDGSDWTDRAVPGGGRVTSFGEERTGDLLVGLENGKIFRSVGIGWEPVDQIGAAVAAIGESVAFGLVAVGANGSIYARFEGDGLIEMPDYPLPDRGASDSAAIAGDNVAIALGPGLRVWDGSLFDTLSPEVREPAGIPDASCRPVAVPPLLPIALRCDNGLHLFRDAGLERVEEVSLGNLRVSAETLTEELASEEIIVIDGQLYRLEGRDALGVEQFRDEWSIGAETPAEEGFLRMASGTSGRIWTLSQNGTVRTGEPAEQFELVSVGSVEAIVQTVHGPDVAPDAPEIAALGEHEGVGRAVLRTGSAFALLSSDGAHSRLELPLTRVRLLRVGTALVAVGAAEDGQIRLASLSPEGTTADWSTPDSSFRAVGAVGSDAVLMTTLDGSEGRLCRAEGCRPVSTPNCARHFLLPEHLVCQQHGGGWGVLPLGDS
ncbi:MAG: hypothetical protein AAGF12_14640 [Myxococcota bacterium]